MEPLSLLLFVGTEGIYHDHQGNGRFMAEVLNRDGEIQATLSTDYGVFEGGLGQYDAVLLYTDVGHLSAGQEEGFLGFVEAGGGFFALHTAAASFRENEGYHRMLNAFFAGHSPYMDFAVDVVDAAHPITADLERFEVTDELHYLTHNPSRSRHLMSAYDETRDETHVMAFTHDCGNGRVFFFALGHDDPTMRHPTFQEVLRRGSLWVGKRL